MSGKEKILVPLSPGSRDLNGVYHALALAERMNVKITILQLQNDANHSSEKNIKEQILLDLVNSAIQDGLCVSYHISGDPMEKEILNILLEKSIDLVIIGEDPEMETALLRIKSKIPVQIIQVKGKNRLNYL